MTADLHPPERHLDPTLDVLRPFAMPDLVRLGCDCDGGYVIPHTVLERADALISFGVGNNWTFEAAICDRLPSIPIHCYDHTISALDFGQKRQNALKALIGWPLNVISGSCSMLDLPRRYRIYRYRRSISTSYDSFFQANRVHYRERVFNRKENQNDVTVQDVFARLPHCRSILLKMDIEGDEYRVTNDILEYSDRAILLTIEFHDTDPLRHLFLEHVRRICAEFRIVHVHGNNMCGVANDGLPEALEITFLRSQFVDIDHRRTRLPLGGLDFPNDPSRPDLALHWRRLLASMALS